MECFGFFENGEELGENENFTLIQKRDLGGLVKPYPDVVDMIECVNSVVESVASDPNMLSDSNIFDKCVVLSEKVVSDRKPYNISTLCQHK